MSEFSAAFPPERSAATPDPAARELDAGLLDWMCEAPAGFVRGGATRAERYGQSPEEAARSEGRFERLAVDLFAHQFERIPIYRSYAERLARTPSRVRRARDVPALPVEAFKRGRTAAFAPDREIARFETSGTTDGRPGTLHLDSLELYQASLERGFRHHVLPDRDRIRMLLLVPPAAEAPRSSLAYMLERVRALWGAPGSQSFVRAGKLHWPELRAALEACRDAGEPVCLLGTAFAWVHVLDACAETGFHVQLPPASRLLETGGF